MPIQVSLSGMRSDRGDSSHSRGSRRRLNKMLPAAGSKRPAVPSLPYLHPDPIMRLALLSLLLATQPLSAQSQSAADTAAYAEAALERRKSSEDRPR